MILDQAGQKGTGKWTTQAALDLGVPVPTITAAVDARFLSSMKAIRSRAAQAFGVERRSIEGFNREEVLGWLRDALYAAKIVSYAQGFDLLRRADREFGYGLDLGEIARIWKAGCIIRARFLDRIREAYLRSPDLEHLLLDDSFSRAVNERSSDWRRALEIGMVLDLPMAALTSALAYYDALRSERLPANLIQAQRDFFGAHTYERTDREGVFHTDWA